MTPHDVQLSGVVSMMSLGERVGQEEVVRFTLGVKNIMVVSLTWLLKALSCHL